MSVTRIGRFHAGEPVVAVLGGDGSPMTLPTGGWSHF